MLGAKLKKLRKELSITQEELAKNIGVTTSMVGMYETDARKPSYEVLLKIADYFNVFIDYLMGATPFKNETEAYHSISIASVSFLKEHPEEIPDYWYADLSLEIMYEDKIDSEIISYCENLVLKFNKNLYLTNLELFELSNILFSTIKWSTDFNGIVYFEDFNEDVFSIKIDFKTIDKIILNLNESFLFKFKNSNDFSFIKRTSIFNNQNSFYIKNSTKIDNTKKLAKELKTIPKEFTNPDEARAYINQHQIFGSNGFNADNLDDDEILQFANELLRQMEMVSYKYRK